MRSFLLTLLLAGAAPAQIVYVDAAAAAGGNGASWATAFQTLQAGLAAAGSGSRVWVAAGTYSGTFAVPASVTVLGGFSAGDSRLTQRHTVIKRVTLDGGGTQRVLTLGNGAVLDGVLVQNGRAGAPGGGGLLIDGIAAATVRNCIFRLNTDTVGKGAAILVRNNANPTFESCLLYSNGSAGSGAALAIDGGLGTFLNLTIADNFVTGIRFQGGSHPTFFNTIIAGNSGDGIDHVDAADAPTLENNLFEGNTGAIYRHLGQALTTIAQVNALPLAANNIAGSPAFASGSDYRLTAASAAVDAGHPSQAPADRQDLWRNGRDSDGDLDASLRIDVGAHEFTNVALSMTQHASHGHLHPLLSGTAGLPAALLLSIGQTAGFRFVPWGYLFLDPGVLVALPAGALPKTMTIDIPQGLAGAVFHWQAVAAGGSSLNFSEPADLQIE
jgi:parallel beta-helix repeat protein